MAKARAILKRRRAVRNIRKITNTMQMIATAKFQKSLKRAVGSKPYTLKVRELVQQLAESVGGVVEHPLLRQPDEKTRTGKHIVLVVTSNRGLAGAYNGNVLRRAALFIRELEAQGSQIELYVVGKKGINFFNYRKRPIRGKGDAKDVPSYDSVEQVVSPLIQRFVDGEVDAVHMAYMNFFSTAVQRPEVLTILPLAGLQETLERLALQAAEREAQLKAGALDVKRTGADVKVDTTVSKLQADYEFSPSAEDLLDELLPLTVKTAFFQSFLDATTSEHVARMVAMKSATDNADKVGKVLQLKYNRARQSQITTELSEIMGGVEAMKG